MFGFIGHTVVAKISGSGVKIGVTLGIEGDEDGNSVLVKNGNSITMRTYLITN